MKHHIVVGAGFGDEGKGLFTSYLVRELRAGLTVRFNGGCQAAHNVITDDGLHHTFSHFGAGTFEGARTFWSRFCPVSPLALEVEWKALAPKLTTARARSWSYILQVDPRCPVTTLWDIMANRVRARETKHGTCATGFGATIARHENTPHRLIALDLLTPEVLKWKLEQIADYYEKRGVLAPEAVARRDVYVREFMRTVKRGSWRAAIERPEFVFERERNIVYEGAQGILLDQDHGFFPHVTRSSTTAKNAMALIDELPKKKHRRNRAVYYVSRSYHTRHGAGPMPCDPLKDPTVLERDEKNEHNGWQGDFRSGQLNMDLYRYALGVGDLYTAGCEINYVVTCCDQVAPDAFDRNFIPVAYKSFGPKTGDVRRYDR